MNLDPRTIIIVNILGTLLMSGGLFVVSLGYLEQINGIRRWSVASLIHSIGWILYALRDKAPDAITIILSQAALITSLAIYFNILTDFTGRKFRRYLPYIVVVINIIGLAYFLWVHPSTPARIVVVSINSAVLLFACTYILAFSPDKKPASHLLTGAAFAIPAFVLTTRGIYYLFFNDDQNVNPLGSGILQSITFLTTYVTAVMITFGFLLMSNDRYVAEHEKAEAQVIKSERGLNDAQKIAKVGSWEFNLDTQELIWSKEQYNIFELPETPSDKLFELCRTKIHPDDIAKMDEALEIGRKEGKGVIYEHRIICKDGRIKHLLGTGETFYGSDGEVSMLRGTVQDITEQKRAEETAKKYAILEAKSKEMEQFAYIASHDLREPLLTIKNYAALFSEEYEGKLDEESEDYLERINTAAGRMDELMRGLLDYSRLSKVKELQQVDSNEVMKNTLADLNSLITSNEAQITVETLPVLKAYPLELKQLFQNILANAIKFRKKDVTPVIYISARNTGGIWTFEFKDNGIGIAEQDKGKIFDIFQRLHNRKEYPGSGIGLAYCKKIVELHHGTIWVDSVLGVGTSFYFSIAT